MIAAIFPQETNQAKYAVFRRSCHDAELEPSKRQNEPEKPAPCEKMPWEESLPMDERGGRMEKIRIEQHTFMGSVWVAAWLFTIGFLHLGFWRGVLAILLWPYYLGVNFSSLAH